MHTPLPDHASLGTGPSRRATPVAEHREAVGERMRAATVAENTGHADDHRGDQDDEPKCQGTRGPARWRTRNLPGGGHPICPSAATGTASVRVCAPPQSSPSWWGCGLRQVGESDELVTTRAGTADVNAPAEQVAVGTAPVAEVALLAVRTLVDDGEQRVLGWHGAAGGGAPPAVGNLAAGGTTIGAAALLSERGAADRAGAAQRPGRSRRCDGRLGIVTPRAGGGAHQRLPSSGMTPVPATAWASRTLSPLVGHRWAWCSSRSTVAVARVLGISSSKEAGCRLDDTATERFSYAASTRR